MTTRRRLALPALALGLLMLTVDAHAADKMLPEAREQYRLGLEAYDGREYELALEKFRSSHRIFASPNSELYVARCLRFIGRTQEAITSYERAIDIAERRARDNPQYADTLDAARRELAILKPPPPPRQRFVPAIWTAGAISATGWLGFGVFSALASSKYHSLENECNPLPCPASQSGNVEVGRQYQLGANISLTVGVTFAITAVTLYVLGRPRTPSWGSVAIVGNQLKWTGDF